ncbi:MAG: tRNA adenosine(34) deaminase TadA [Acidobacteriota bacterium]
MEHSRAGDGRFLDRALALARRAAAAGEIPVGAVVVARGRVVGRGFNRPATSRDPTAHAEIVALRRAALRLGNYRLPGTTVYVTLEPCLMCVGAMVHARIRRLVYGAADPKVGAVDLARALASRHALNHHFAVTSGVRREACQELLRGYFRGWRRASLP